MKIYSYPRDCKALFVSVGTPSRPASISDMNNSMKSFLEMRDLVYGADNGPSLAFSLDPLLGIGARVSLMELNDIEALKSELLNPERDGFNVIILGNDENPASQEDIDNLSKELSGKGLALISHHSVDISYTMQ